MTMSPATSDAEALERIEGLIAKLKNARTVAEVQRAGHELMRSVVEYRRAHPLRG
jgi:hypothetical protein